MRYPINLDVEDKICVVVGGGAVAHRKILGLLEAGAEIFLIAPDICSELRALISTDDQGAPPTLPPVECGAQPRTVVPPCAGGALKKTVGDVQPRTACPPAPAAPFSSVDGALIKSVGGARTVGGAHIKLVGDAQQRTACPPAPAAPASSVDGARVKFFDGALIKSAQEPARPSEESTAPTPQGGNHDHCWAPTSEGGSGGGAHKISWLRQKYEYGCIPRGVLLIAATDDPDVNRQAAVEAAEKNMLVNVVDKSDVPDDVRRFENPSTIRRGDLLLTISTGGKSPALSKSIRLELEKFFPPNIDSENLEVAVRNALDCYRTQSQNRAD